jgi:hypothetical protein
MSLNLAGQPFHIETDKGWVYAGDATAAQWRSAKEHDKRNWARQFIEAIVGISNVLHVPADVRLIPELETIAARMYAKRTD